MQCLIIWFHDILMNLSICSIYGDACENQNLMHLSGKAEVFRQKYIRGRGNHLLSGIFGILRFCNGWIITDSHSFVVIVRGKLFFKDTVGEARLTNIEIIVFQRKTQGDWL
jgi:hypothetical protein